MATGGVLGNGSKIGYSESSPVSWTNVPDLIDMTIPTMVSKRVDNTISSTTSSLERTMPGMQTVGDPTFTVRQDLDPSTSPEQAALRAYQAAGTTIWWRYEVPVNRAKTLFMGYHFQAAVANYEPATPLGDRQTTKFTLMFDGDSLTEDDAAGATQIS